MRLTVDYRTFYAFGEPQRRVIQLLRVTPSSFEGQAVIDWRIDVDRDARLKTRVDGYGNVYTMLYVDGPVDAITLSVRGEVLTEDRAGLVLGAPEPLAPGLFLRATPQTRPDAAITAFAREVAGLGDDRLGRVHALMASLNARIAFDTVLTDPTRGAAAAFAEGRGVCQDHAHIFCAVARLLGYPARYVSGHLLRDGGTAVQPAGHAWAEAWVEDYGWIGFDVTNNVCPTDAYIRVAVGLDYHDAAPISGARIGGGGEAMHVEVAVAQAAASRQD
ncbi:MAG TPA: transglutaminase family protein [Sphingomonas sp.]